MQFRVSFETSDDLRSAARWACATLLSAFGVDWVEVTPGSDAEFAYIAAAHAWDFDREQPPLAATDPLAAAYWWLARVEELDAPADAFDEHGRFRAEASHLSRIDDQTPVDTIADQLGAQLGLVRTVWPGGQPYAIALTHDIDVPWRWTRSGVRRAMRAVRDDLRGGRIIAALAGIGRLKAALIWRLLKRDPWCNGAAVMRLEQRAGARSTSYLLLGGDSARDGDAQAQQRGRRRWARDVVRGGGRLGVHGSYDTSTDPDGALLREQVVELAQLRDELSDTELCAVDHRFHYLRHHPPTAWPLMSNAGIQTDSSLGYAARPGLRAGWSLPMLAWNHAARQPLPLVIVPLAFMDASLEPRYLNIAPGAAWQQVLSPLVSQLAKHHGGASVLWHNDKLGGSDARAYRRLYQRLLGELSDAGAWATDVASLADAWVARLPTRLQPPQE